MYPSSIQQTSIARSSTVAVRQVNLTPGQVFQGQVQKLFPNNVATLRIGTVTVTARLEAALTAGLPYWFEVQPDTGIPKLKVLGQWQGREAGSSQQTTGLQATILQQLGLPNTKMNELLVRHFSNMHIPFSKEMLQSASQIIEKHGLSKGNIALIQQMIERNIPVKLSLFEAFGATQTKEPLLQQMTQLLNQIKADTPEKGKLVEALRHLTDSVAVPSHATPITRLLQALSVEPREDNRIAWMNILQKTGVVKEPHIFYNQFKDAMFQGNNQKIVHELWPGLANTLEQFRSTEPQAMFRVFMSQLSVTNEARANQQAQQLLSLLPQGATVQSVHEKLSKLLTEPIQETEKNMIASLLDRDARDNIRNGFLSFVTSIMKTVGFTHENELLKMFEAQSGKVALQGESMKSLLLQLVQLESNQTLKTQAEAILSRITGQQLIASEQSGPLHQLALQIPVQLGNHQTDVTIQWEGKKTKEGQIDKEHCRILFYLQLEKLHETIIDVQIQKKIVSIQIFNEHPKPKALPAIQAVLKSKLTNIEYQLSSVNWVTVKESSAPPIKHTYGSKVSYEGVDVRI
ncbi:hypothetical protein [Alkalihalobacillus sp. LMS39]|uniref:hypothetical protein n=1 Tax=Alkalihalobacillus sp. LMS39 TaxID=2924032 RepID=UPI001FB4AD99|nr:hypothetical protein [Alkalihalobacillus sp. LMS39]UOE92858.1 hypothetical protein MM271_16745 [Alkalihalobacillus sp. LMS39]